MQKITQYVCIFLLSLGVCSLVQAGEILGDYTVEIDESGTTIYKSASGLELTGDFTFDQDVIFDVKGTIVINEASVISASNITFNGCAFTVDVSASILDAGSVNIGSSTHVYEGSLGRSSGAVSVVGSGSQVFMDRSVFALDTIDISSPWIAAGNVQIVPLQSVAFTPVPEPSTYALMIGCVVLLFVGVRKCARK